MAYQLVIFDFDGTLADSFPWLVRNVNQAAARHGFRPVDEAEIEGLRGLSARQVMERLEVPAWKVPKIAIDMHRRMAADIDQIQLFAGVEAALARLEEGGVRLALLTSKSQANARKVLGEANAARMAAFSCGASVFGKQAKLRKLLGQLDVPRDAVLCVGDELRDLEAARKEGLAFGAVAWGYTRLDALAAQAPEVTFHTPQQLGELG